MRTKETEEGGTGGFGGRSVETEGVDFYGAFFSERERERERETTRV